MREADCKEIASGASSKTDCTRAVITSLQPHVKYVSILHLNHRARDHLNTSFGWQIRAKQLWLSPCSGIRPFVHIFVFLLTDCDVSQLEIRRLMLRRLNYEQQTKKAASGLKSDVVERGFSRDGFFSSLVFSWK